MLFERKGININIPSLPVIPPEVNGVFWGMFLGSKYLVTRCLEAYGIYSYQMVIWNDLWFIMYFEQLEQKAKTRSTKYK